MGGFNAGDLEWEPFPEPERWGPGMERKLLSYDSGTGSTTQLVRGLTPEPDRPWAPGEDLLLLVLGGTARLGDRELRRHGFALLPAGMPLRGGVRGDAACELLWLGLGGPGGIARSRGVRTGDLLEQPWRAQLPGRPGRLPPGLLVKPIWRDPDSGAQVFLSGSLMRRVTEARWEEHPCAEEQVYLAGEFTQFEVLRGGAVALHYGAGGYSFRPPGIWHLGPGSGTDSYCLRLVRTSGALVNRFSPEPLPYPAGYLW